MEETLRLFVEWHYELSKELGKQAEEVYMMNQVRYNPTLTEILVARLSLQEPVLAGISPKVYYTELNKEQEVYVSVVEYLCPDNVSHFNCYPEGPGADNWLSKDIRQVLKDLAALHSSFMDRVDDIIEGFPSQVLLADTVERNHLGFRLAQLEYDIRDFPDCFPPKRAILARLAMRNIDRANAVLDKAKKTFCHVDFTPRNLCLRRKSSPKGYHLCAYDWELAQVTVPQRDVISFLAFALPQDRYPSEHHDHVEYYRNELRAALSQRSSSLANEVTEADWFYSVYDMCIMQYIFSCLPWLAIVARHPNRSFSASTYKLVAHNMLGYLERIGHRYDFLSV